MMQSKTFSRKVAYLIAIAVLFVPLAYLSAPGQRRHFRRRQA